MLTKLKSQESKQQVQVADDLSSLVKTFTKLAESKHSDVKWVVK